ncbi:MAG TPA: amylo-alpha-1,6-glucosidase [Chloroflexia bacterium]|nr:amylo-alpha-1,6-glucosidase [Chloroflexia bacterium]
MFSSFDQLVLKEEGVFATSNLRGDMPLGQSMGLYCNDTRYLSLYYITVEGREPVLLSSSSEQNFIANLQLTNPPLGLENGSTILPNTVSLRRNRLMQGGMRERIGLFSYNTFPVHLRLRIDLGADFRDMFDVRGFPRNGRGTMHDPIWEGEVLTLSYTGLDNKERYTRISFDPLPTHLWMSPAPEQPISDQHLDSIYPGNTATLKETIIPPAAHAQWEVELQPHQPWFVNLSAVPEGPPERQLAYIFDEEARDLRRSYQGWRGESAHLTTDNAVFNAVLDRSMSDLRALVDHVPGGLFPAAGIPWYSVPFGRDSLITGLQTLMFRPDIAEGTLRYLARYQGERVDPWRDEEPGKILHELRFGEMASLNEIPHTPYYGTVDATPLFVMLFAETIRWTNDEVLYNDLLPNVFRALDWIDNHGDPDGDGFVEYETKSRWGLRNQGWKDSYDSLKFPDGKLPKPPIALVEVQAYVYAAKVGMAELLMSRGDTMNGARLAREAHLLKERFNHDFWMADKGFYAQALDGSKRQVPSISSNAGHTLYCGIADPGKAAQVVRRLMSPDLLCGWGIRTLSSDEPHFNPMSYHNGSIWPHDNGIIAAGMRRYGFGEEAAQVIWQVVEAGTRFKMLRMPELYCGFARDLRYYSVPAEYPVSCSPQAWAAGAILHFCQTMLDVRPDALRNTITLNPYQPTDINSMQLANLRLGNRTLDLQAARGADPPVTVQRNPDGVEVLRDK